MPIDWKTVLFGRPKRPEKSTELAAEGLLAALRPVGHTVELLDVTPHGGDLHLVVATVDGAPFRNYVPTGDIHGEKPEIQRRIIARRVRAMATRPPHAPSLTGKEVGLP